MKVSVQHEGVVSRVILDNPPLNLLDIETMDALVDAHKEADAHPETRVILTESAVPHVFCNGLDPQYVLSLEEGKRTDVFRAVGRMLHGLFSLGKPHISLIKGPAMAGGAVLAITSDFRIFDVEHGRLSFSEPKVGLPIPEAITAVIKQYCARPFLRDVVMLAKNMDARQAMLAGLADSAAKPEGFDEVVQKLVERLARLSPSVLKETKRGMRCEALVKTAAFLEGDAAFDRFVGDGFLGEGLKALVEERFPNFKA